jgi:hypothetical protein
LQPLLTQIEQTERDLKSAQTWWAVLSDSSQCFFARSGLVIVFRLLVALVCLFMVVLALFLLVENAILLVSTPI